jgi:hypothetical protein
MPIAVLPARHSGYAIQPALAVSQRRGPFSPDAAASRVFHPCDSSSPPLPHLILLQADSGKEPCQTTSFSLGSNRATTASSERLSCLFLRRRVALQPRIAAPRLTKRGSGLRSKLPRWAFRSSGRTIGHGLPAVDFQRCGDMDRYRVFPAGKVYQVVATLPNGSTRLLRTWRTEEEAASCGIRRHVKLRGAPGSLSPSRTWTTAPVGVPNTFSSS